MVFVVRHADYAPLLKQSLAGREGAGTSFLPIAWFSLVWVGLLGIVVCHVDYASSPWFKQ